MFDNILRFACLFLSGDLTLLQSSPEYFIEKFEYFFGKNLKIKKHDRECKMYKENVERWSVEDYRINSILMFLIEIIKSNDYELLHKQTTQPLTAVIKCTPDNYIKFFNKWIGDVNLIDKSFKKLGLHKLLEIQMVEKYYEIYENETNKIILNEKLKKIKYV